MRAGLAAAAIGLTGLAVLGGCGEQAPEPAPDSERAQPSPAAKRPDRQPRVEPARCPPAGANCRSATGEVVYVEAVDADGDGDAHFVLLSPEGVTAPGISVIDVGAELRPRPLPRPGDRLSAAGPVYPGSYGQRQIEATELRVARAE